MDSGMFHEVNFSYSKKSRTPEPVFNEIEHSKQTEPEVLHKRKSDKLYIGHLPFHISKRDIDELFGRYGPLANIEIKHGGYAFVQFG